MRQKKTKDYYDKITGDTDAAKKFKESEEFDKLKAARNDFRETIGKFMESVENTQNPANIVNKTNATFWQIYWLSQWIQS